MMIHLPEFRENFYVDVDKIVALYPMREIGEDTFRHIRIQTVNGSEESEFETENEMIIAFTKIKNILMKVKNESD